MQAEFRLLHSSSTGKVIDFRCKEEPHSVSEPEQAERYSISFIRKGNFYYDIDGKRYEFDTQSLVLENLGSYHIARHDRINGDECTVFEIAPTLLEEARATYWKRDGLGSVSRYADDSSFFPLPIAESTPSLEYLHCSLLRLVQERAGENGLLHPNLLIVALVDEFFRTIYGDAGKRILRQLDHRLKDRHLETVELAKHYITSNFDHDISLAEIAEHSFVSEFHFSRIFRQITNRSPYQYLIEVRLKHALLLLQNTPLSITEVCFASGFNSFSHFVDTFARRIGLSPSKARAHPLRQIF